MDEYLIGRFVLLLFLHPIPGITEGMLIRDRPWTPNLCYAPLLLTFSINHFSHCALILFLLLSSLLLYQLLLLLLLNPHYCHLLLSSINDCLKFIIITDTLAIPMEWRCIFTIIIKRNDGV